MIITLKARVANNDQANAGVSFANTASYTYAGMPPGLATASTSAPVTLVEPKVAIAKTVANLTNPARRQASGISCATPCASPPAAGRSGIHSPMPST